MKMINDTTRTNAFVFTKKLCRHLPAALGAVVILAALQPAGATPYIWGVTSGKQGHYEQLESKLHPGLGITLPTDSVTVL